jgi:type IV secretion system protein VirB2
MRENTIVKSYGEIGKKYWTNPQNGFKFPHMTTQFQPSGGDNMPRRLRLAKHPVHPLAILRRKRTAFLVLMVLVFTAAAQAQSGSPFDTGFTALQTLFTGTVAKVASLIAIVIGGYGFAHGEPGAKKALAGVAAGTGIAVLSANVLSWLWGV